MSVAAQTQIARELRRGVRLGQGGAILMLVGIGVHWLTTWGSGPGFAVAIIGLAMFMQGSGYIGAARRIREAGK